MPETSNNPYIPQEVEDIFAGSDNSAANSTTNYATPTINSVADNATSGYASPYGSSRSSRSATWIRYIVIALIAVVGISAIAGVIWLVFSFIPSRSSQLPDEAVTDQAGDQANVVVPGDAVDTNSDNSNQVVLPGDAVDQNGNTNTTVPDTSASTTEDSDFDGLSNAEETEYNTNPLKQDTDSDGLSDREEVRVYGTDPRNPDTDGDGYTDGQEVANFYDPNNSDSSKRLFDL